MDNSEKDEIQKIALNAQRIQFLERKLDEVINNSQKLNVNQLKQMCQLIGIPIGLATGVFGLALWQLVSTTASDRAAQEVDTISEEIYRLQSELSRIAGNAVVQFEDVYKTAGKVEEATRTVLTRADMARNQASEVDRLLSKMKSDLAAVPEIQALLRNTGTISGELASNEDFKASVTGSVLGSLSGAVVAFAAKCPEEFGWVPYEAGRGRVIVGAGTTTDDRGETRDFNPVGFIGGEFQHTLTIEEMPPHNHDGVWGGEGGKAGMNNDFAYHASGYKQIPIEGGGLPHNNMPPYITLQLCKKENI